MLRKHLFLLAAVFPFVAVACAIPVAASTPPPTVNLITPRHGTTLGGTKVTIVGTNLSGATAVDFGAKPATNFTVVSDSSITAVSPPDTGTVDVTVTTVGGTNQSTPSDKFVYVVPVPFVSAVDPDEGPITGGTKVTITGTNLGGATVVDFGSTPATSIRQSKGEPLIVTSPPGTGTVDVTVTTAHGTSSVGPADEFTYVAYKPTVRTVAPKRGATSGGTTVKILGANFTNVTAVTFGANPAAKFTVVSIDEITAVTPLGSSTVAVTVTTKQGSSVIGPKDQFVYGFPPPTVTALLPAKGGVLGGTRVTIVGTNLVGTTAVNFGSTPATSFKVNSETRVTATAPAGLGTAGVTVTTLGGTSLTGTADQFTYVAHPPTVVSVFPNVGLAGDTVSIRGSEFKDVTAVDFGSLPASFQVNSPDVIAATAPSGSGTVDITVITPQGTSTVSLFDRFNYQ